MTGRQFPTRSKCCLPADLPTDGAVAHILLSLCLSSLRSASSCFAVAARENPQKLVPQTKPPLTRFETHRSIPHILTPEVFESSSVDVLMLRKIACCTACLAARGLAPGSSFALPTQVTTRTEHSRSKIGFVGGVQQIPSASQQQQQKQRQRQELSAILTGRPLRCRRGDEEIDSSISEDPSSARDDAVVPSVAARALAEAADRAQDPVKEALAASKKTFVTGAILACSMFASSALNLETTAPVHAMAQQQQQQQQQQSTAMVAPQLPRKVRPPPPEIPPGRITIVQWCERNIGRYLPKVDVQAAAETAEKIRVNSGPAPTVEDLRRMAGDVANREWGGLLGEALAGRGKKLADLSGGAASSEVGYSSSTVPGNTVCPWLLCTRYLVPDLVYGKHHFVCDRHMSHVTFTWYFW